MKTLFGVTILIAAALSGCLPYTTGSNEVGVRTVKWSITGKKGVVDEVYPPGTMHFFVPFLTDWYKFDTRLQVLEMMEAPAVDRAGRDELLFKTIDGNDIGLEVLISYRIIPEMAPKILQEVATTDNDLREGIVRTISRSKPRDIFGELNTEQFYVATEREKKADEVQAALNEILNPYGVIVEKVSTKDYRFNPEYQKAIEKKTVAEQEAARLRSETKAKTEEYRTLVEQEKAEVEKIKASADGEYQRAVIEADAYYEQQQRIAEAILAEGQAEAEAILKMNEALSGPGGEAIVKLAIAGALKNKRIVMLPTGGGGLDLRTTDVNSLLQLYGIQSLANKSAGTTSGTATKPAAQPAPPGATEKK